MVTGQPDYTRQVAVTVFSPPAAIDVNVQSQTAAVDVQFPATQDVNIKSQTSNVNTAVQSVPANMTTVPSLPIIAANDVSYEDTSFVTGESGRVLDVYTDLGRAGIDGYMVNDGDGDIKYEISYDGTNYGGIHVVKKNEVIKFTHRQIKKIRLTWVADCGYRILVV